MYTIVAGTVMIYRDASKLKWTDEIPGNVKVWVYFCIFVLKKSHEKTKTDNESQL